MFCAPIKCLQYFKNINGGGGGCFDQPMAKCHFDWCEDISSDEIESLTSSMNQRLFSN